MISRELIEKIRVGDAITDDELDVAVQFYRDLEQSLALLGSHFHFAWLDVLLTRDRLIGYKMARNNS